MMDRVKIYEKQVVFPTYEAGKPEKMYCDS